MKYTRDDYENFLNKELETQMKEYEQLANTKSIVLKERGDVFVGRFLKLLPNGMAIFKIRHSDNMPRKNSFWTATYFIGEMGSFKNWGDNSWAELRSKFQRTYSDTLCAWIAKSDESDYYLIGIKNLSTEFAQLLENENPIVAFGPNDPPLQYLLNLIDIVRDLSYPKIKLILDYEETSNKWNPQKINANANFTDLLLEQMDSSDCIVVQGPPGTGKTYRMAQLVAKLLNDNKSVLVTSLTNQALMELVKKDDIKQFLDSGKVSKTSLTIDESRMMPMLQGVKDNKCNASAGYLSLATFYISSAWAKESIDIPFDYVIMDEASQALFPMIAASLKLGKKNIWIGDQKQLPPIVITNDDIISQFHWSEIVKGFDTLCHNFAFSSFMLSDTFRLTQRGADATGVFYQNELHSVAETQLIPSSITQMNRYGGPMFVGLDLKVGDKSPFNAFDYIYNFVKEIIAENSKAEIAILSKFRESVRQLQKFFILNWQANEIPDNIKIETVDRVQGLTVDYCFFLIPNTSLKYSLDSELFNVATSRARYSTIVIANNVTLRENMEENVRKYLLKSQENKFATFEPVLPEISERKMGVTIVGKIDLTKLERKRSELSRDKENIYIIDTNVFVKCPDIISKIGRQYKVIIPAKVLEELDKLKLKAEVDKKVLNYAAKNISVAFTNNYSTMEDADITLLPSGFDRRNPDCMILSVALKYKLENPILLTSDNMLLTRAKGLGITCVSLKDFLRR